MSLREQLREQLRTSMKERDRSAASVLRTTIAAIDNAEAVPITERPAAGAIEVAVGVGAAEADRRELSEQQVRAIVVDQLAEHRAAAEAVRVARPDRAAELEQQAGVLGAVLERADA